MKPYRFSTPEPIFAAINREFRFSFDLCADADNAKCEQFYLRGESLSQAWDKVDGWAWLNPPYGREISEWVRAAALCGSRIVAMLPGRTNAPWWHDYAMRATEIRFIRRKVSFYEVNGKKGVPSWGAVFAIFDGTRTGPVVCKSWDWK